jgi:hypothetical protein
MKSRTNSYWDDRDDRRGASLRDWQQELVLWQPYKKTGLRLYKPQPRLLLQLPPLSQWSPAVDATTLRMGVPILAKFYLAEQLPI